MYSNDRKLITVANKLRLDVLDFEDILFDLATLNLSELVWLKLQISAAIEAKTQNLETRIQELELRLQELESYESY